MTCSGEQPAQGEGGGYLQEHDDAAVDPDEQPVRAGVHAVVGEEHRERRVVLPVDEVDDGDRAEQHEDGRPRAQLPPQPSAAQTPVRGRGRGRGRPGRDDPGGPDGEEEGAEAVRDEEPAVRESGRDQGPERCAHREAGVGHAAGDGEGLAPGALRHGDGDQRGVGGPDHPGGVLGERQDEGQQARRDRRQDDEGGAAERGGGEQHAAVAEAVAVPAAGEVPGDQADAADADDQARLGGAEAARAGQVEEDEDEGEADDGIDEDPRSQQPHSPRYVLEPLQHTRVPRIPEAGQFLWERTMSA